MFNLFYLLPSYQRGRYVQQISTNGESPPVVINSVDIRPVYSKQNSYFN